MEGLDHIERLDALQCRVVRIPEGWKHFEGCEAPAFIELSGLRICGAGARPGDGLHLQELHLLREKPRLSMGKQKRTKALGLASAVTAMQ